MFVCLLHQSSDKELIPPANYVIKRRQIAYGVDFLHRMLLFSHDISPWRNSLQFVMASSLSRLHDRTQTRRTRQYSSGRVIRPTQKLLHENTQHSQETHTSILARDSNSQSEPPLVSAFCHVSHYSHGHSIQENEFYFVSVSKIISI
jgi:hypothetical protein